MYYSVFNGGNNVDLYELIEPTSENPKCNVQVVNIRKEHTNNKSTSRQNAGDEGECSY